MLLREAADSILADLDSYVRAAKPADKPATKPQNTADDSTDGVDGGGTGEPLPTGEDDITAADIPDDPDQIKDMILGEVHEQLDWDGSGGDPNASKDALEDALADMFDADVDILWDGQSQLTLQVEGEDPVPLTADYLGELLEQLAKSGRLGDEGDTADDGGGEQGNNSGSDGEREFWPDWVRSGVVDAHGHLHAPKGIGGGRFAPKGGGVGGVVKKAAKAAGKVADKAEGKAATAAKPGGGRKGPHPVDLAKRAKGRAGPRAASKAVGSALSAGTGRRIKVSGNRDGTFNVGPKKRKMTGKKVALLMVGTWLAAATATALLVSVGVPAGVGGFAMTALSIGLVHGAIKTLRSM